MQDKKYIKNLLHIDNLSVTKLAQKYSTPFYLYSERTICQNFMTFKEAAIAHEINDHLICFALKSNPNKHLVKALASLGAGADIVSGGELKRALECGIDPQKIVFSGVGKTEKEIELALNSHKDGIYSFNVESIEELEMIGKISQKNKKKARVALRLNPQVHVKTHKHISTGYKTHKFGLLKKDILKSIKSKKLWENVKLVGLSVHIGSQLTCLKATRKAIKETCDMGREIMSQIKKPLEFIDVGGGLGVDYHKDQSPPTPNDYMKQVAAEMKKSFYKQAGYIPKLVFEPGRVISASAGLFITQVIRTKTSEECYFAIVDGGMNDFVRTSLYDAYHEIIPVQKNTRKKVKTEIVGPICESADYFASGLTISKLRAGDYIAVCDVGAYGHSMSSNYNMRKRPTEIVITSQKKLLIEEYVDEFS